ncbi:MAG TPA: Gfo/Idh/MocA family oxidoreductase, partial [Chloroflexaceae bacterium]|nr:Gfo/Idh/MocA family oxidoreductase [Chloroflexaceae bacterium]
MDSRMRVAIVGCGNIAEPYARNLVTFPQVELVGYSDLVPERAEALAAKHGGRVYPSLDAVLADPSVELVVNLTIHQAHYQVSRAILEAGKHLMSEKPLALTYAEASELVALAAARGLRIGGTPFTFMGEGQQTAMKLVREGRLGTVRVAYAEVNWGRLETWHPNPAPFYAVGPLFDVGVYPLMLLTALLGPARQVQAYGRVVHPERVTKGGAPFTVTTPDFVVAMVELEGGALIRLTANFYVLNKASQQGVELHGDLGSLRLSSWFEPYGTVQLAPFGEPYEEVAPLREPPPTVRWGLNVAELADALREGRPHRATGEHAAHVV